jgi:SAM-dependent methyltransferase
MRERSYTAIVAHYEACLKRHGVGARAVDWKSEADAALRYDIMLGVVSDPAEPATLLDFGCGLAGLKDHMACKAWPAIAYTGLEISPEFAAAAQTTHPGTRILCLDVLVNPDALGAFDYIVMNGIFTRRHTLSVEVMRTYFEQLVLLMFSKCRRGLAFNVMSKSVDWESEALFHAEPGALLEFVARKVTRHYVLRNDYGLHETTLYLYREPVAARQRAERSR